MRDFRSVRELAGRRVALAASGGLDSCTIAAYLQENGVPVTSFTADLGQPGETMDQIVARMTACGASECVVLPLRDKMVDAVMSLIQMQAIYDGGYWNTTGLARHVTTVAIANRMAKLGIDVLVTGCTGRGNDQFRFGRILSSVQPGIVMYQPWRDDDFLKKFPGRGEMIDYCEARKLPIVASRERSYSTDGNVLGLTHEAGKLESLLCAASEIEPGMGVHRRNAPDEPDMFEVRFECGVPVQINGVAVTKWEALTLANAIAGKHGVGIAKSVIENRIVDLKGRGVYEQPGITLLGGCYETILQLILNDDARELFTTLARKAAKLIYHGQGLDLAAQMTFRGVQAVTELATGTVRVVVYKGGLDFAAVTDAPHALYDPDTTSMEGVGEFDHTYSFGIAGVQNIAARTSARAGHIRPGGIIANISD